MAPAPARTPIGRNTDILVYFDTPGACSSPTEAVNEQAENRQGLALGSRNLASHTTRSLVGTDRLNDRIQVAAQTRR